MRPKQGPHSASSKSALPPYLGRHRAPENISITMISSSVEQYSIHSRWCDMWQINNNRWLKWQLQEIGRKWNNSDYCWVLYVWLWDCQSYLRVGCLAGNIFLWVCTTSPREMDCCQHRMGCLISCCTSMPLQYFSHVLIARTLLCFLQVQRQGESCVLNNGGADIYTYTIQYNIIDRCIRQINCETDLLTHLGRSPVPAPVWNPTREWNQPYISFIQYRGLIPSTGSIWHHKYS